MTSETSREHERRRNRRVAAHEHAAAVHDQASQLHEDAAEFFGQHGWADQAERERSMARQEKEDAAANRDQAAAEKHC